jgi:wyosine [tRNA(Phe)-imidazoG37] synthetase (radical SAM superfamily)
MTVGRLINLLQTLNEDEPIVFQFLIAEHVNYSAEDFERIADFLKDSGPFGEDIARVLKEWCGEAFDNLDEWEEED